MPEFNKPLEEGPSPGKKSGDPLPDFRKLLSDLPVAVYCCDLQGQITFYNEAAGRLWGRSPDTADRWCGAWKAYQTDGQVIMPHNSPMARMIQSGHFGEATEIQIERPDHTFRQLLVHPRPIYGPGRQLVGGHSTLIDITGQKTGEEKQAILSAIVASSDDAIISKTLLGVITSWNNGARQIFGYTEAEMLGKPINVLIPQDLQEEEVHILQQLRQGKKIDHFQTIRLDKYGRKIPVSLTVSPVRDNKGNIIGASKIARDISRQLATEQALKRHAENLDWLNAIGKLISANLDTASVLQQVTDACTKITGAAFGAFFFNTDIAPPRHFVCSGDPGTLQEWLKKDSSQELFAATFTEGKVVRAADMAHGPGLSRGPGGPPYPLRSYLAVPVVSASGTVIGGLCFGHHQAGQFLREHEDMVSSVASQAAVALENSRLFEEVKALNVRKDEFIALASHELKTPLTSVKGYLQILKKNEQTGIGRLFIDKSIAQVEKLDKLVSDLFDISKIEAGRLQLNREEFDMAELLQDIAETFRHSGNSQKIVLELAARRVPVVADRQRIEQVIVNLLTNAVKYAPGTDKITISLDSGPGGITVKVRDEGIGLSKEQQEQIFNRFYRVEGHQNISGLGLGLYLSKEIIDRHKGTLKVKSRPGAGAEFFFTIPASHPIADDPTGE